MNSPWAIGLGLLVLLGTCRCRAAKFSLAGSPKYCHELHKCVLMDIELLVHVFRRPVSPRKASSARHVLFKDESPPPPPPPPPPLRTSCAGTSSLAPSSPLLLLGALLLGKGRGEILRTDVAALQSLADVGLEL